MSNPRHTSVLVARLRREITRGVAIGALAVGALLWPAAAGALAPGDLDPTFGVGGSALYPWGAGSAASSQVNAVALQPDGRIVLGGVATDPKGQKAFMVARLNADGTPDRSFADNGKLVVQLGSGVSNPSSAVRALAVQADGGILAGGSVTVNDSAEFLVTRLNPNGSFDSTFGDTGRVILDELGSPDLMLSNGEFNALAVQADGKILAGGDGNVPPDGPPIGVVARLIAANGSLDSGFGASGAVIVITPSPLGRHASWSVNGLALQPDGQIVLAGEATTNFNQILVARLKGGDGSYDSQFGDGGKVLYQPFEMDEGKGSGAQAVALQPDGKIVFGATASGSDHPGWSMVVGRLNSRDGSFDSAFADHGKLIAQLGAGGDSAFTQVNALALQPDGRIVLGGTATDSHLNNQLLAARLNGSDGGLDPAFGSDGQVLHQFGSGDAGVSEVHALALQSDGRILAAGGADGEALIVRLIAELPAPPVTPQGPGTPPVTPAVPPPVANPAVSKLRLSPVAFAAADRGGSIARRTGTTVSYVDSQAATTTFTVLKPTRGVKSGGRCLKPSRGRHGRACTRYVTVGRFTHGDSGGQNSFHFSGRVRHHKLAPGRYRLQAIPRFAGRTGHKTTTNFRIVP